MSNTVASTEPKAMKSIPMKYLKYMCYGLYLLKRICPHPEEYAARSVELLKLHGSVEEIIHDIDYILDGPLQTEMHEIKAIRKNLNKPAKGAKKMAAALKNKPLAAAIVESAQQSTVEHVIARSDNDQSDNDQSDNDQSGHDDISDIIGTDAPVVKTKKLVKVTKTAAGIAKTAATSMETAEKAVHEAIQTVKAQREAEKAAEKAQKEAEKAQKEAQKEAEKAQKEAQKEAEKAQKEAEKAQKEAQKAAEKAQKEAEKAAEKAQKEAEKAKKEAEKAAEKAKKDAEKATKVKSIKVPVAVTAELTAESEK